MKSAVITFPGSNREGDVIRALHQASGVEPLKIWHQDHELPQGTDLVVLPGGFSYGDYLRCGAIASRSPVMDAVRSHAAKGGLVLGICNGFQILVESGLLPGVLMRNAGLKFICKMQHLKVCRGNTPFTSAYKKNQIIKVAIAHGEGNYIADDETIAMLEDGNRIAFRYCDAGGDTEKGNPNGSINSIAGIYSKKLNVLGMMPHPENLIETLVGGTDGRGLFASVTAYKGAA
ncbi:MAG: phosphoribosylformylglycinamidine synthase subunit PurQ [Hyphomicrobiales bacterium]